MPDREKITYTATIVPDKAHRIESIYLEPPVYKAERQATISRSIGGEFIRHYVKDVPRSQFRVHDFLKTPEELIAAMDAALEDDSVVPSELMQTPITPERYASYIAHRAWTNKSS